MTDPQTALAAAKTPEAREESHRAFIERIRKTEFETKPVPAPVVPQPQLILAWTAAGLVIEAPGAGGAARAKIDGVSFDMLPAPMQAALLEQKDRIDSERARQNAIAARERASRPTPPARPIVEVERRLENERIAAERFAKWTAYLESLPAPERERQIAKRDAAFARRQAQLDENAKQLYAYTAGKHSIDLANRVIPDPKRRPKAARRSATRVAKATTKSGVDLTRLTEGVDYKVYSW